MSKTIISWNVNGIRAAEKKGYSGVAVYTKTKPFSVTNLNVDNCYFPNSQSEVKSADILKEVMGSDHCPVKVVLK